MIVEVVNTWPGRCTIINGRPRHPQTQGLIEQANGTVQTSLRAMRQDEGPDFDWPSAIPGIQYALNTSYQSSIKMTPYKAVYGKEANLNTLFGIEGEHGVDSSKRVDGVIQEEQLPDEIFDEEESNSEKESMSTPVVPPFMQSRTFRFHATNAATN